MLVTVEEISPHSDQRGSVWEPIACDQIAKHSNCHIVITEPGGLRGNHFHKLGTETTIQRGPALVKYRDETGVHSVEIAAGRIVRFVFPPNCPHAFLNNGDEPNLLIGFNTEAFNSDSPDAYPEVLIQEGTPPREEA